MLQYLYQWIENIAFYLVIMTAVIQVIPNMGYKKYLQFFSGLVLVMLLISPVLRILGMEESFYDIYHNKEYEQERREIEASTQYLEDMELEQILLEEYQAYSQTEPEESERQIEIEGVRIGQ